MLCVCKYERQKPSGLQNEAVGGRWRKWRQNSSLETGCQQESKVIFFIFIFGNLHYAPQWSGAGLFRLQPGAVAALCSMHEALPIDPIAHITTSSCIALSDTSRVWWTGWKPPTNGLEMRAVGLSSSVPEMKRSGQSCKRKYIKNQIKRAPQPTQAAPGQFLVRLFDRTFQRLLLNTFALSSFEREERSRRACKAASKRRLLHHTGDKTGVSLKKIQHKNVHVCTGTCGLSRNLCPSSAFWFSGSSSVFFLQQSVPVDGSWSTKSNWKGLRLV